MVNSMLLPLLVLPAAWSSPAHYQPVSGNLTVSSFQLYPENAAFDPQRRLVYLSDLYNASVTAYDPFRNQVVNHIKIPGITGDGLHHAAGVQVDPFGYLSIVVSAGDAFNTAGQDISGDNFLVKYDLEKGCVAWKYNLTAITNGIYGGPQDLEHDVFGNTFVVGTFPKSIMRVSFDGKNALAWYLLPSTNHTIRGFSGIAATGDILVVSNDEDGLLYRFDARATKGKPVPISLSTGATPIGNALDGIRLPALYNGTVLLVSDHNLGTVVLRSKEATWASAEYLGSVANPFLSQGGSTVASVQVGQRIYSVTEYFGDESAKVPGTLAGNRTEFPLEDVTDQIQKLLV